MGADLRIPAIQQPVTDIWRPLLDAAITERQGCPEGSNEYASAQRKVEEAWDHIYGDKAPGYFRDSYNVTSVLWRLGLSWWNDLEYDVDDEDAEINVSAEACSRFLELVLSKELSPATESELRDRNAKVDDGENSVEKWNSFYAEKLERLVAFLRLAADNGGMAAST